jgi:hypothetical protein
LTAGLTSVAAAHADQQVESVDEPGVGPVVEEPGTGEPILLRSRPDLLVEKGPSFRLELAFGWASLLVDPDVGQGMGGGLYFAMGLNHRLGLELSVFLSSNPYLGEIANISSYTYSFLAGNITLGPIVQLTRPGSRFMITLDFGLGAYVIPQILQDMVWTFGLSGGFTFGYRLAHWFGFGIKPRYHIFHLGGPEFRDPIAFRKVGVVDRFEMPGYLAFYF